jgi:hypothetical protein
MELTYGGAPRVAPEDDLAPEQTRDIPFFGFVAGTLLSLLLWSAIAWTLWAIIV